MNFYDIVKKWSNVGIAIINHPFLMVGIPPIKMVMNGGWCKWHCYTHINMDQFLGITGSCVCDIDMENPCAWLALPGYKVPTQMPNMFL